MSTAVAEFVMRSDSEKMVAYQVRCPKSWIDNVRRAAKSLGMSAAAYIRMKTTQGMIQDGFLLPNQPPKKGRSHP